MSRSTFRARSLSSYVVLAPAILFPALALAQDRDDDPPRDGDIVVTGTKTGDFGAKSGIPIQLVPQSIQVIDAEDIIDRGARTIEDALRAVPSATVARNRVSGFAGNTLRIRGFAAQQIRNGIFQRFYDGTDPSALSNVARIEVLKWPSALLYGQSGVGGIVSVITKQPTDAFAGSIALTAGSYDQKLVTVDIGGPITDTLAIRLTGEIERSGSFVDLLDVDRENVGLALAWKLTHRLQRTLSPNISTARRSTIRACRRSAPSSPTASRR